jgi:DNA-binding LacI/PurR family transcriptional regulator
MRRLLSLEESPSAVFAASDLMALGAIRTASEAGLAVPGDISIVGFDDIPFAEHTSPPLTTLRQDKHGLGAAAGDALIRRLERGDGELPAAETLPVNLQLRGTTAQPRR